MNNMLPASVGKLILLLFSILLIGAVVFYRQRMLFLDPCFITFEILNKGSFVLSEYRYGAFITQIVPLIGGLLKIDLNTILVLYSASFYIFYCGVLFFLIYRFKQFGLALLMAFYYVLFASDVYYWPNNEVHQGVAWMFLFYGLLFSKNFISGNIFFKLLTVIAAFLAVFSHLIVAIPLFFLWAYFFFSKRYFQLPQKSFQIITIILIALFCMRMWLSSQGWYDGEKLKATFDLTVTTFIDSFSNGHLKSLLAYSISNYWIAIIIFLTGTGALLWQRHFLLAIMVIGFVTGFLILLSLTYPGDVERNMLFYIESQWMALGIIIGAPFVFHFLPLLKSHHILLIILVVFAIRLIYIGRSAKLFNTRLDALTTIVDTLRAHDIPKAFRPDDSAFKETFLMTWGMPVETLVLSAITRGDTHVTLKLTEEMINNDQQNIFYSSFRKMDVHELNNDYFRVDTITPYQPAPLLSF